MANDADQRKSHFILNNTATAEPFQRSGGGGSTQVLSRNRLIALMRLILLPAAQRL